MGCGASKVTPQSDEDTKPLNTSAKTIDHDVRPNGHANGNIHHRPKSSNDKEVKVSKTVEESKAAHNGGIHLNSPENKDVFNKQSFDKQADDTVTAENGGVSHVSPLPPVSKPVAFDIVLGRSDSDNKLVPLTNRPPRRLQKIESAPVLTREALQQKQAAAEQNRQKELEKKVKLMSKRRSELLIAREMDKAQRQKAELEERLAASDKKREKTQAEIIAKQKKREEKAMKVRLRAKQMKDGDDVVGLDVDPDETYNADEEDESWDITIPLSHESGSGELDDHNNNQTLDDTEFAEPQIKKSGQRADNQDQNLNDVHDFFDS